MIDIAAAEERLKSFPSLTPEEEDLLDLYAEVRALRALVDDIGRWFGDGFLLNIERRVDDARRRAYRKGIRHE